VSALAIAPLLFCPQYSRSHSLFFSIECEFWERDRCSKIESSFIIL